MSIEKTRAWIAFFGLAALIIGCGGGGGGGGSSSSGGTITDRRVEAVLASNPTVFVDPLNIQVGDLIQFVVAGRNTAGDRVVATSSNWLTNAPGLVGSLAANGQFSAIGSSGATQYTVSAVSGGATYSTSLQVKPAQALVAGRVRTTSNAAANRIVIRFYNAGGTQVGSVTTATDGTYRASVPTSAVTFHVDFETVDPSNVFYYRQFGFGAFDYSALIGTCRAPLPALTNGVTTGLSDIVVYRILTGEPPPPPPDGC